GWVASDLVGASVSPLDPLLGAAADNGGPIYTSALLAGSPAVDAGDDSLTNSLAFDERGHPRRAGAPVDIGAYEVNPPLTISVLNTNDAGTGSLRQAIVMAAPGDSILFATGVSGTISLTSSELAISKNLTILGPAAPGVTLSGVGRVLHFAA